MCQAKALCIISFIAQVNFFPNRFSDPFHSLNLVEKFKQVALGEGSMILPNNMLASDYWAVLTQCSEVNISFSTIRFHRMKKLLSPWKVIFLVWSETLFQHHRHPKSKGQKPNTDISHSVSLSTYVTHLMRPLDQSSNTRSSKIPFWEPLWTSWSSADLKKSD